MKHQYKLNSFEASHWRERAGSLEKEKNYAI